MRPLVSYVIPTRNRVKTLVRTIREIDKHLDRVPGEIIVIDNASDDRTFETVRSLFPHVKVIRNRTNFSSEARNIGISESRSPYICMLDDDSYPVEDAIARGIDILCNDRRIACVAYRISMPGGSYWTNGLFTTFAGCGALFARKALKDIGGYPSGYGFYVEEYDVSFRLTAKGYRIFNARDLMVYHEQAKENRDTDSIICRLVSNNIKLFFKFFPAEIARPLVEYTLWRYKVIAIKEKALDGYVNGLKISFGKICDTSREKFKRFSVETCHKVLGLDDPRRRIRNFLKSIDGNIVLIYNTGKLTLEIIRIIESCGASVAAVVDDDYSRFDRTIGGRRLITSKAARGCDFDGIVCGSSSLAVNDDAEKAVRESRYLRKFPFLRICDYDDVIYTRKGS